MKVGVLQFFGWRDRSVSLESIYERALERIEVMDQTGYDAVWLAEHHFSGYSVCPSVHLMAMHVASRTKRLRIGTAITLAAFYHPLRIAEEVALLDILSGGRVNWGAGRGFDPVEFENFGVPMNESADRFREAVEIVLAAWESERLTHQGKFHAYRDVEVLPKPKQRPHPPAWVAASSEGAIDWAADQGLAILMDPHSAHDEIARKQRYYDARRAEAGTRAPRIPESDRPIARLVALAETDAEAKRVAERGAAFSSRYLPKEAVAGFRADKQIVDPVDHYMDGVIVHGSPERVTDELRRLESEMPLDYLLLSPLSEKSFDLFTEQVLPNLID
jgi:alkanesulfonate monooxygenase SsuD/methylene tetrahydromethanopterin reductase-like flavin-dependent oxidoreductase (luciferase family)